MASAITEKDPEVKDTEVKDTEEEDTEVKESIGFTVEMKKDFDEMKKNGCPICLKPFVEDDVVAALSGCSHLFHKGCIDIWKLVKLSVCD